MSTKDTGQYFNKGNAIIVGKEIGDNKVSTDGLIVYHAKALSSTEPWFLQNPDKRHLNLNEAIYILGHGLNGKTISGYDMTKISDMLVNNFNYNGQQEIIIMSCEAITKKSDMATDLKSALEKLLKIENISVQAVAHHSNIIVDCLGQAYTKDIKYSWGSNILQERIIKNISVGTLMVGKNENIMKLAEDNKIRIATYCYSLLERGTNILDRFYSRCITYIGLILGVVIQILTLTLMDTKCLNIIAQVLNTNVDSVATLLNKLQLTNKTNMLLLAICCFCFMLFIIRLMAIFNSPIGIFILRIMLFLLALILGYTYVCCIMVILGLQVIAVLSIIILIIILIIDFITPIGK